MNDKTLPGAQIPFQSICSTGFSHSAFGVGDMDISIHRPSGTYPWLDLGRINFSNPTTNQLLDAQTSPAYSEGSKALSDIHRRLSFKQANLIVNMMNVTLSKAFNGEIPADDEVDEFFKKWMEAQKGNDV
jgi:hypothetical protein